MNCATCKHLGDPDPLTEWNSEDGEYSEVVSEHRVCERIPHSTRGDDHREMFAIVSDGSDYIARLRVLPDFGCVLWEQRR